MLLSTLLILLFLFLLTCFTILWHQAAEVDRRKLLFEEALWKRRHLIPLFLEVIGRASIAISERAEIIALRSKVMTAAYTFPEKLELEKKLSALLVHVLQKTAFFQSIKTDTLYIALQKEFDELLQGIRIAQNNYHYSLQKLESYHKLPWFLIFRFVFNKSFKEHPPIM